jgi:hypothetical protein
MKEVNRYIIPTRDLDVARSLCWEGDELVDWAGGGTRYRIDGSFVHRQFNPTFAFDHAVVSADGQYEVIYQRLGTKGLILKNGKFVREINRSYYHADAYDYPISFVTLPDSRTGIIHCPEEYWQLEIEDVETGERLTKREAQFIDFFHSRLAVSPDNHYLLSAGWIWTPFNHICVYDLTQALLEPALLEAPIDYQLARIGVGVNAATFKNEHTLVVTTNDEYYDHEDVEPEEAHLLEPNAIGVFNLENGTFESQAPLQEATGTLMAVGDFVVDFYQHPKLIDPVTGAILERWDDLWSGDQDSSIIWRDKKLPPLALDPVNYRFAVASPEAVTVIQLG